MIGVIQRRPGSVNARRNAFSAQQTIRKDFYSHVIVSQDSKSGSYVHSSKYKSGTGSGLHSSDYNYKSRLKYFLRVSLPNSRKYRYR